MYLLDVIPYTFFLVEGKTAWAAWLSYPKVNEAFLALLSIPIEDMDEQVFHDIERFVAVMFSKTCTLSRVNEAGRELFTQHSLTIDNISPTQAASLEHLKRSVYQAGYVWVKHLIHHLFFQVLDIGDGNLLICVGNHFGPNSQRQQIHALS